MTYEMFGKPNLFYSTEGTEDRLILAASLGSVFSTLFSSLRGGAEVVPTTNHGRPKEGVGGENARAAS